MELNEALPPPGGPSAAVRPSGRAPQRLSPLPGGDTWTSALPPCHRCTGAGPAEPRDDGLNTITGAPQGHELAVHS